MSQEQPPIRSRRQLRQARAERLDADQDTGTPGSGAVPAASNNAASNNAASNSPASTNPATPEPAGVVATGVVDPGEPTEAEVTGRRRNPGPVDSVRTAAGSGRSSQVRARDRATLRSILELAEKESDLSGGGPPTRRQLRLSQLAAETATATSADQTVAADGPTPVGQAADDGPKPAGQAADDGPKTPGQKAAGGTAGQTGQGPKGMTVEQALAARELLAQQAQNQLAKMDHINATDPDAVDPGVLAEQTALAGRAALLNRRTAAGQKPAGQKPAEQNSKPEPVRNDPATANNLAMVTPLEFVQVPGVDWPVLKRPPTSHVPVITTAGPRVEQPGKSGKRPAAGILAAQQPDDDFHGRPPVAANSAYGLEPLDAETAGLGRARRLRLVQLAVLALGLIALIGGVTLIITGLSG